VGRHTNPVSSLGKYVLCGSPSHGALHAKTTFYAALIITYSLWSRPTL
jgi:hypothetical protein